MTGGSCVPSWVRCALACAIAALCFACSSDGDGATPDASGASGTTADGDGAAAADAGGGDDSTGTGAPPATGGDGDSGDMETDDSSDGSGGSGVPNTQGDAPAGYCPGYDPAPGDAPCWDGNAAGCSLCYAPLRPRAPCMGTGGGPAPAPLPICTSDADCVRRDTYCDPGHPYANSQGCRPPGCDEGASCPDGTVCDPDSPLANPAFLKGPEPAGHTTTGCRLVTCADPGGPECEAPMICDPGAAPPNARGCRLPSCNAAEPCPAGYGCDEANGTCRGLLCNEPGAAPCPDGTRCTDNGGCAAIHCSEPDGIACTDGYRCEPGAPGSGCTPLPCDQPGATPCPEGTYCADLGATARCVECVENADCGCGSCVESLCYTRPGYCEPGCA